MDYPPPHAVADSQGDGNGCVAETISRLRSAPFRLYRLQVQGAGRAVAALADIVAETLADRGSDVLVPLDRACLEAKVVAACFLDDFAVALDRVE